MVKEGILLTADIDSIAGLLELLRDEVTLSGLLAAATFSILIGTVAEEAEVAITKPTFSENGTSLPTAFLKVPREGLTRPASIVGRNCSGWKNGLVS